MKISVRCGIGSLAWSSRQGLYPSNVILWLALKSEGGQGDAGVSSAGLFPLHKEVFNLVEVFETAQLPRAIERFIK